METEQASGASVGTGAHVGGRPAVGDADDIARRVVSVVSAPLPERATLLLFSSCDVAVSREDAAALYTVSSVRQIIRRMLQVRAVLLVSIVDGPTGSAPELLEEAVRRMGFRLLVVRRS
jgi:uncharacterized protein YbjT (DUF2867 family)